MRTVFVIDDDELMREVLSRHLEKNGYRARAFQSPYHALPLIDAHHPDAVVSDLQMPGMTGLELARRMRELSPATPIVLVTAAATPAVREEAERAGVTELFAKPIGDVSRLVRVLDRSIAEREARSESAALDGLRLSFLTGLAHELRTPLTAIKLALENLFAAQAGDHRGTEGRLLAISQRNLDRIVGLVERQLDLLQITLGDVSVARRLVSIRDLIESVVSESPQSLRKRVRITHTGEERPYCFTDPDRLRAAARYLLEAASSDGDRPLAVEYGEAEDGEKIELRFSGARIHGCLCGGESDADDFERRAFRRIIASLGGEIRDIEGCETGGVLVTIPVLPRFDAREDFEAPVECLREAAMLSGKTLSILKCRPGDDASSGRRMTPEHKEFFDRCRSAVSEGDALVRGRPDGTYYLLLVERRQEELDHVAEFLRAPGPSGQSTRVEIETTASVDSAGEAPQPAAEVAAEVR